MATRRSKSFGSREQQNSPHLDNELPAVEYHISNERNERTSDHYTTPRSSARDSYSILRKKPIQTKKKRSSSIQRIDSSEFSFEDFERDAILEAEKRKSSGITESKDKSQSDHSLNPILRNTTDYESSKGLDDPRSHFSVKNKRIDGTEHPRLSFGQTRTSTESKSRHKNRSESIDSNRLQFDNAKSISSDQYFARKEYDPILDEVSQNRLHDFDDATGITSDEYFGRPQNAESPTSSDYIDRAKEIAYSLAVQADSELNTVKTFIGNKTSQISSSIWNK
ncbi:hypothetical protein V1511DRAFT_497860 [Dipodascopsis uninucleata]